MEQDYKVLMAFIRYVKDCDIPLDETAVHSFLCSMEHGIAVGNIKVESNEVTQKRSGELLSETPVPYKVFTPGFEQDKEASHGELGDSNPGE
jgi:hypothetical protein